MLAQDTGYETRLLAGLVTALVGIFVGVVIPTITHYRRLIRDLTKKHLEELKIVNAEKTAMRIAYEGYIKEQKKEYEEKEDIIEAKHAVQIDAVYADLQKCETDRELALLFKARWEERVRELERAIQAKIRARQDKGRLYIVFASVGASKMFGYTRTELINKPVEVLIAPSHRGLHLENVKKHDNIWEDPEFTKVIPNGLAVHKNGMTFPVTIELSKVESDGELLWQAIITQD